MAPSVTKPSIELLQFDTPASDFGYLDFEQRTDSESVYNLRDNKPTNHDLYRADGRLTQHDAALIDATDKSHRSTRIEPPRLLSELRKFARLALPIVVIYAFDVLPVMISIMLVGRIDSPHTTEYVDGAALSSMLLSLSGEAVAIGLATALDTLCSQAHGAGQPRKIGISFQTGLLVLSIAYIPVFIINWFAEDLLRLIQQPEEVSVLAGRFSRLLLPGLPFMFLYELLKKVLQAQNIVAPMIYIAVLSNAVNLGLGMYLTWHTSLGYDGAAIARAVANVVLPLSTVPYFLWKRENFYVWWPGWQPRAALAHVRGFLELGVPGMLTVVLDYLSYDTVAVLVAYLPNGVVAISVHSVLWSVANVAFNMYLGVAVATTVVVGNYVGSGQKHHAKLAANLGIAVVLALSLCIIVVIVAARTVLPALFVSDHAAVEMASAALLYLVPFEILDAVHCVMQGIFRGTGRQNFAAIINIVGLFVIGLPCRVVFAFSLDMGVEGFWLGLTVGYACCFGASLMKIVRTDWASMVQEAKQRMDG